MAEGDGVRRETWVVKVPEELAILMELAESETGKTRSELVREAVTNAHSHLLTKARAVQLDREAERCKRHVAELERIRDALVKPDDARSVERRSSRRASSAKSSTA